MKKILLLLLLLLLLSTYAFPQTKKDVINNSFVTDTIIDSYLSNVMLYYHKDKLVYADEKDSFIEIREKTININDKFYGDYSFVKINENKVIMLLVMIPTPKGGIRFEEWLLMSLKGEKGIVVVKDKITFMYWFEDKLVKRT